MFTRKLLLLMLGSALGAVSALAQGITVDEIVSKHMAAMGGPDKLKAIKTSKATGKMILGGGQMEATLIAYSRRPSQNRMEINLQGQKIIQAFDGKTAWMINPMTGNPDPQKMPVDESKTAADDADPDGSPLIDYKAKGHQVQFVGKEEVEGAMAYKLTIVLKSGTTSTLYLDEKTFMPSKSVSKRKQMGQEMEIEAYPSNYKLVDGVMMPFASEVKVGGRTMMQNIIEKIETNIPVDEAMFAFPVKETPPPPQPPKPQPKQ